MSNLIRGLFVVSAFVLMGSANVALAQPNHPNIQGTVQGFSGSAVTSFDPLPGGYITGSGTFSIPTGSSVQGAVMIVNGPSGVVPGAMTYTRIATNVLQMDIYSWDGRVDFLLPGLYSAKGTVQITDPNGLHRNVEGNFNPTTVP